MDETKSRIYKSSSPSTLLKAGELITDDLRGSADSHAPMEKPVDARPNRLYRPRSFAIQTTAGGVFYEDIYSDATRVRIYIDR